MHTAITKGYPTQEKSNTKEWNSHGTKENS
jgi:hypothetical protein